MVEPPRASEGVSPAALDGTLEEFAICGPLTPLWLAGVTQRGYTAIAGIAARLWCYARARSRPMPPTGSRPGPYLCFLPGRGSLLEKPSHR
jgi:hypothetical protein